MKAIHSRILLLPVALFGIGLHARAADNSPAALAALHLRDSPFEMCQGKGAGGIPALSLSRSDYDKNKDVIDSVIKDCASHVQIEVGDTGFFTQVKDALQEQLGRQDQNRAAIAFLKKVGQSAQKNIEARIRFSDQIIECANNPTQGKCKEILQARAAEITAARAKLRAAWALSNHSSYAQAFEDPDGQKSNVNFHLLPITPALRFPAKYEELSETESRAAIAQFDAETKEIRQAWALQQSQTKKQLEKMKAERNLDERTFRQLYPYYDDLDKQATNFNSPQFHQFLTQERGKKLEDHRGEALAQIFRLPILAFLGTKDATDGCAAGKADDCKIVLAAESKLEESFKKNSARIQQTLAGKDTVDGANTLHLDPNVSSLLPLMSNGTILRDLLSKDQGDCRVATELAQLSQNVKTKDGIAIGGLAMGGFLLGGYAGGAALGAMGVSATTASALAMASAGSLTAYASYRQDKAAANLESERFLSGTSDSQQYRSAQEALQLNLLTSPANLFGTGLSKVLIGGVASAAAAHEGALMASRAAARKTLIAALEKKEIPEERISQLMHDLDSRTPATAKAAVAELQRTLGLNTDAIDVIQKAADRGLISALTYQGAISAINQQVHDGKTAAETIAILEKINPSRLNETNRAAILDTTLSGARLGISPALIAEHVNNWDQGLDGLASLYQKTAAKLESNPAFGQLTGESRDAYRNQALKETLEEMHKENPILKSLPEAEWSKQEKEMIGCATGVK